MKHILLFFSILFFTFTDIYSQTIYSCDFEDDAENAQWVLNSAGSSITFANKWYIDNGINNGGEKSLYISTDGGLTPGYSVGSMMISYRTIKLDPGDYEISFDWLAGGAGGSDALFVAWVPEGVNTNSSPNYGKPGFLNTYGLMPKSQTNDSLQGASWKTSIFPIKDYDGSNYKLVFVWMNATNSSNVKGACIDNILIAPEGLCDQPQDLKLKYENNSVVFTWTGNAPQYEVKYYSYETEQWTTRSNITSNSLILPNIPEGFYDFYVRAVCGTYHGHWASKNMLVYLKALRCIDYMDLEDADCWIGMTYNDGKGQKVIYDKGSDSKESRHTIHYNQTKDEYDPRTNNVLPTVPPDERASVRLGNWDVNAEAECIEYTYTVDAKNAPVLIMKYAVVMNEPKEPHKYDQQARFELNILRGNHEIPCAQADFRASYDTSDDTWHYESSNGGGVWWKEWTTIGVNLEPYDGETLTIRLTTRDCENTGHYAYAYYILYCIDKKMDGLGCGENPTTNFIAPEGFEYRWYLPDNPNVTLGVDQTFDVDPSDTLTYYCDIIFPQDKQCYFTLTASAVPRYPIAEATYDISHENCLNQVLFDNTSHVLTVNQITGDSAHTTTVCEWIEWDFGDGFVTDEYSPKHEFPLEGGTFVVKMKAGISTCVDSLEFTIELPNLVPNFDTIAEFVCLGKSYTLPNGRMVWNTGVYYDTIPLLYDCYDVTVYDLTFVGVTNEEIRDTICSGESYYFDGEYHTIGGTYTADGLSMYGCDSITTLYLTVTETVEVELETDDIYACHEEGTVEIPYTIVSGKVSSYRLDAPGLESISGIAQSPLVIPLTGLLPGYYPGELIFFDDACGNDTIVLNLNVLYNSSIIAQRWNDVLAVKSSVNNGGYMFSSYQWYKDNIAIPGATKSYLFEPGDLDMDAVYTVELIRMGETEAVMSCGVIPERLDVDFQLLENQAVAGSNYRINTSQNGTAKIYSLTGVVVSEQNFTSGSVNVKAPDTQGYYILQIRFEDQTEKTFQINVTN